MSSIPHYDVTLSSTNTNENSPEMMELIRKVRPKWESKDSIVKRLELGYINNLFTTQHKDDVAKNDIILVRLANIESDVFVNINDGFAALKLSTETGCTPPIYATFNNGIVQKFVQVIDKNPTYKKMFEEPFCRLLGSKMARLHSLKDKFLAKEGVTKQIVLFKRIYKNLDSIPDNEGEISEENRKIFEDFGLSKAWMLKETQLMEKYFHPGTLQTVLSHGDFSHVNTLITHKNGGFEISFVDFDFGGLDYDVYDFAYFSDVIPLYHAIGAVDDWAPSDDDFRRLLRHYLRARSEINTGKETEPSEDEVEDFYRNVKIISAIPFLWFLGLWMVALINPIFNFTTEELVQLFDAGKRLYLSKRKYIIPDDEMV